MPESLVFVPFEYLGGTPSTEEWIGRATAAIVARQTSSLASASVRDAQNNRIPHVVEGYVSGADGALQARVTVRDEAKQRTLRSFEARGANVLQLASALAGQMVANPKPYTTANVDAVRELFAGNVEGALAKDPKYGSAHVARVEAALRSGKPDDIRAAAAAATNANLSDFERAQVSAFTAETPQARAQALLQAARVARYDLALWRGAAEAALTAKQHAGAVEAFQKAAVLDPENIAIWNTMAYAQAFSGDLEGANRSLAQYAKLQPRDANVFDSKGEILFYEGRFKEAEQEFLRAFEMDNTRLGGGEAYRAAVSAFLAGDRIKAESNFGRYLAIRKQSQDPALGLRESIWLYTTGRGDEARNKAAVSALPAAKAQVAFWDALEGKAAPPFGDRPEPTGWKLLAGGRYAEAVEYWKRIYDANSLINGNEARVMLAVALEAAKRPAEGQALLAKWPLPPTGADPGFSSVVLTNAIRIKGAGR